MAAPWRITAALSMAVLLGAGCDSAKTPTIDAPARQFRMYDLQLSERKGEQTLWTGTAERAEGELGDAQLYNVELTRPPQSAGEVPYTLVAPRARLDLGGESGFFEDVRVSDPSGGELRAGDATYSEAAKRIELSGPLEFEAHGLIATAPKATVLLDEGVVNIEGPVVGRYRPTNAAP